MAWPVSFPDISRHPAPMTETLERPERPAELLLLVHSSDLHVDDAVTADAYGGDGTAGLRRVLQAAAQTRADIVLLAGDIFDHNRLPLEILGRAADLLRADRKSTRLNSS